LPTSRRTSALRLQRSQEKVATGYPPKELDSWAERAHLGSRRHARRRSARRKEGGQVARRAIFMINGFQARPLRWR
jgi:hypothetical protein